MSRDCCVALPRDATGCLQFVIVVFPDHTHLLILDCLIVMIFLFSVINNLKKTDPSEIERTYDIRKQQTRFYWACS